MLEFWQQLPNIASAVQDNPIGLLAIAIAIFSIFVLALIKGAPWWARFLLALSSFIGLCLLTYVIIDYSPDKMVQFEINLRYFHVVSNCEERADNEGDFYYSIRIDGNVVASISKSDAVKVHSGDYIPIGEKKIFKRPINSEFILSGFIEDIDEKVGTRNQQRVNFRREFWSGTSGEKIIELIESPSLNRPPCHINLFIEFLKLNG